MNNKATSYKLQAASCKPQATSEKFDPRFACGLKLEACSAAAPRASRGFSLIELMVSMVIGLFILAGVVYVMANSRKNYETTDYTARLQENARFALHYLSYDLRNAGFWGCSDTVTWTTSAVDGEDHQSLATLYGDRIRIEYADPNNALAVATGVTSGSSTININTSAPSPYKTSPSGAGIAAGDWVIISDCASAEDAIVASVTSSSITLAGTLTQNFSGAPEIRKLISHRYYVAPSTNGGDFAVLCRENQKGAVNDPGSSPVCINASTSTLDQTDLVQGVEYLRVLYGEDTDGDGVANAYQDRSAVTNWNSVVAVQLGLLVRSVSNYRPDINPNREFGSAGAGDVDVKTYSILDKTGNNAVNPTDLRVARRVITETIQIRNATMNSPSA